MERRRLKHFNRRDGLDPELLKIYRDGDGQVPDVSRLQIYHVNWTKRLLAWALLVAATAATSIWLIGTVRDGAGAGENPSSVRVEIVAPKELASGEEVAYTVKYRNADRVAVSSVELTLRYPEGFTFVSAVPAPVNQYTNSWRINALAPGDGGEIKLTAKVVGPVGGLKTLAGTVNYRPQNFSSTFKDDFSKTFQITSSILNLSVNGPERAVPDRESSYEISYENTAEKPYEGVLIQVDYPPGFIFRTSEPAPKSPPASVANFSGLTGKDPNSRWYFTTLGAKAKGVIKITGGFGGATGDAAFTEQVLTAHIGLIDETGGFSLQQEQRLTTVLVRPSLQVNLIINGQSADQPVNLGDTLNYRIVYKNLGQETLEDVLIEASIDSSVVDLKTIVDKNLGTVSDNTIRWAKDVIPELAALGPLAEGTLDFSLQLVAPETIDDETRDLATVSTARAVIGAINGLSAEQEVSSGTITNSVNTALELKAEGRYFNDDNIAVGSGPLPPVVGERTSFRIYWSLGNSLHDVKEVTVSTVLAADVVWEGKFLATTGQLTYDAKERRITWTIPIITAKQTAEDVNAWFDMAVTPTQEQVGKLLLLTSETSLTANDAVTDSTVVGLKRSITSNLEDDPFGGGRGLVVEIGQ